MAFCTSEAVVLRRVSFRNTSCVLDLLTRRRGRISLLAKGARRPASPFFGLLDYCVVCDTVFIEKGPESMGILTECSVRTWFHALRTEGGRLGASLLFLRFVRELAPAGTDGIPFFDLCVRFFADVNACPRSRVPGVYLRGVLRLLHVAGYRLDVSRCSACGGGDVLKRGMRVDAAEYDFLCRKCASRKKGKKYLDLSPEICMIIRELQDRSGGTPLTRGKVLPAEEVILEVMSAVVQKDMRSCSVERYGIVSAM